MSESELARSSFVLAAHQCEEVDARRRRLRPRQRAALLLLLPQRRHDVVFDRLALGVDLPERVAQSGKPRLLRSRPST